MNNPLSLKTYLIILSGLLVAVCAYPNILHAKNDEANNNKQPAKVNYKINDDSEKSNESKVADKLQFFNRADWRIQNINMLVNKWQTANDYKILCMELDSLSKLVGLSESLITDEMDKSEFLENISSIKNICSDMILLAGKQKHDDIKVKANELFLKYAKLKLSLKEKTLNDFQ